MSTIPVAPASHVAGGEKSPDYGKRELLQNAIDDKATAGNGAVGVADGVQSGNRVGRTLKGILGKRGSA
jgi:hypothetical protein